MAGGLLPGCLAVGEGIRLWRSPLLLPHFLLAQGFGHVRFVQNLLAGVGGAGSWKWTYELTHYEHLSLVKGAGVGRMWECSTADGSGN